MKTTTRIPTIINITYIVLVVFFLLDGLTSFEIKNQFLKSIIYFGLLIGTPIVLFYNLIVLKSTKKFLGVILPTLIIALILLGGLLNFINSSNAWRTQTILYQNGHLPFKKIEFQMQDKGAFGYNRRTVEVIYLTNLFTIVSDVDTNINGKIEWVKVDQDVNELGLKYP